MPKRQRVILVPCAEGRLFASIKVRSALRNTSNNIGKVESFLSLSKVEKNDYMKYWKVTSADDWKRVNLLFKNRDYIFALFCAHLTLEKLMKAHWVKDNTGNFPPKIHNLVRLAEQIKVQFSEEDLDYLRQMNTFQLEGRYPDYQRALKRFYKSAGTKKIIKHANDIRKCLLKELQ